MDDDEKLSATPKGPPPTDQRDQPLAFDTALRASEERFRTLFEAMSEGFAIDEIILDEAGRPFDLRYLEVNPAFERYTGLTKERVTGRTARELFPDAEQSWFDVFGKVALTGIPAHFEARFGPLGRWFDVHAYRVAPGRFATVFFDITQRKETELALRDSEERLREADRRKDEFIAMLGHELRNPLAPIRNAVQILNVVAAHEPSALQARQMIDRQSAHMARLIDDLLDIARVTHGKLEVNRSRCDLAAIVSNTIEDYQPQLQSCGLHLSVDVPSKSVWVNGDATRLSQIIGNVLHNSLKFTEPGGYISVRLLLKGDGCEIQIRDTGIGMDTATLANMFDAFNQADRSLDRSRGGLGLGMALVKHLVELHDGQVDVRSEGLGKGSEVSIRIPVELAAPLVETDQPMPKNANSAGLRVLVIEDNVDAADSLCILLQLSGHLTEKAHTGPAGVKAAQVFLPDVVLCDLGLPGLDGYGVARALRHEKRLKAAYLVALTGYGQEEDQRRTREAGFDLHLVKPIDHAALEMALACRSAGDATRQQ
jgi:PAS domain S-box-containing protein